jgi:hypothetical protein
MPRIEQAAHHDRGKSYNFPKGIRSTPLLATAFLASRSPGKTKLDAWLRTLTTGLDAIRDNPAYQLRERLMGGIIAPARVCSSALP